MTKYMIKESKVPEFCKSNMKPGPTRCEVLAVVSVKIMVFWNVSLCGLVDRYQCFAVPSYILKMEAAVLKKCWYLSSRLHSTTYIPEDIHYFLLPEPCLHGLNTEHLLHTANSPLSGMCGVMEYASYVRKTFTKTQFFVDFHPSQVFYVPIFLVSKS